MKKTFIHFCSDFPAILKINEKTLGTLKNQNETLSIEIQNEKSFLLCVFPISHKDFFNSSPFFAELELKNNTISSNSPQLEITKFEDYIFEVFITPFNVVPFYPEKTTKEFNPTKNIKVVLTRSSFSDLEIYFNEQIISKQIPQISKDEKCEFFEKNSTKFLLFSGKTQKNKDFLIVFENFFCKFEIEADKIEKNKNEILALNYAHDISRHGIVQKFVLEKSGFNMKEEYVVFCDNKEYDLKHESLVPMAFLESLNLEDFRLARTFLSEELNNLLEDGQLKNFFGEYEEFFFNRHKNQENCVCFVSKGTPKTTKNFCFEVKNFKIVNIYEEKS